MHFQIYLDRGGDYRWQLKTSDGRIIADSSEGYVNKSSCIDSILEVKNSNGITPVKDC